MIQNNTIPQLTDALGNLKTVESDQDAISDYVIIVIQKWDRCTRLYRNFLSCFEL